MLDLGGLRASNPINRREVAGAGSIGLVHALWPTFRFSNEVGEMTRAIYEILFFFEAPVRTVDCCVYTMIHKANKRHSQG